MIKKDQPSSFTRGLINKEARMRGGVFGNLVRRKEGSQAICINVEASQLGWSDLGKIERHS